MSDPVVQVWSAPKSAGGAPLGAVPYVLAEGRIIVTHALTGSQGVTLTVSRETARDTGMDEGAWLRIVDDVAGTTEWMITQVTDADGAGRDTVTVQAGALRNILTTSGRIRSLPTVGSPVTSFTPGPRTVAQLMTLYYEPTRARDGLSWLTYAGSEFESAIDVGTLSGWTYGRLLDEIERRTSYEWEFVNDNDAGYTMTLVRRRGASTETIGLAPSVELLRFERTRDITAGVTVVDPTTSGGLAIGETCWLVRQISGTGPYWIALADPAGGPDVIREDGQLVGAFVVPADAAPIEILDARSSDSAVQLASIGGLTVGGLVTLWDTVDGRLVSSITSPSGLGSSRGRIVQTVQGASPYTARNLVPDGLLTSGLRGWTPIDTATGYDAQTQVWSRSDPLATTGAAAGGESSGATSVDVDGLPAGFAIRRGDVVQVGGVEYVCDAAAVVSATGTATVSVVGTLSATIAGDVELSVTSSGRVTTCLTDGSNASGASDLTLKGLTASTAIAASDVLAVDVGAAGLVQLSSVTTGGSPYTFGTVPLPFGMPSGTVLRVTENQFSGTEPFWGGIIMTALATGGAPEFTANINPLPVDIPAGTVLQISETRRQVGGRTQIVTYEGTVLTICAAGTLSIDYSAPDRPPDGVYVFVSGSAPFSLGGENRTVVYDVTLTSDYIADALTFIASATRPTEGWSFLSGYADFRSVTGRAYTVTGSPPLWNTSGTASITITGTLFETLPVGTVFRWRRGTTVLGDLTLTTAASGGTSTLVLQGGPAVSLIAVDTTFSLPAFTTHTTASTSADGAGAAVLTVPATPSTIADNTPITVRRCPDLAPDLPGGPNVLRLRGASGQGTSAVGFTSAQYRQAGIFAWYSGIRRVVVPAGESVTIRARLTYTLWGSESAAAVNCRAVLWNVTGTAAILGETSIVTGSTTPCPYTADLASVTHGEITISAVVTATTRVELALYPLSTAAGSWLFARTVSLWVGDADVPPMDGADNNALWHKAQDVLAVGNMTARYRGTLSPRATTPLTLGGYVRVASSWLDTDVTLRVVRVSAIYPQSTEGPQVEFDVLRPFLSREL